MMMMMMMMMAMMAAAVVMTMTEWQVVELEMPRPASHRTLRLWKFPWPVSADQQVPAAHDPMIVALANKLAASAFLARAVTRSPPAPPPVDAAALRHWCLVVESCILEAATAAAGVDGTPLDSVPLFAREVRTGYSVVM